MVYKFMFFKGSGGSGGNNTIIQKKTMSLVVCGAQFGRRHIIVIQCVAFGSLKGQDRTLWPTSPNL